MEKEEGGEEEGEEEEEGKRIKERKLLLSHLAHHRPLLPVSEELKRYTFEANTTWPVLPEEVQPKVYQVLFSFILKVCLWILFFEVILGIRAKLLSNRHLRGKQTPNAREDFKSKCLQI